MDPERGVDVGVSASRAIVKAQRECGGGAGDLSVSMPEGFNFGFAESARSLCFVRMAAGPAQTGPALARPYPAPALPPTAPTLLPFLCLYLSTPPLPPSLPCSSGPA